MLDHPYCLQLLTTAIFIGFEHGVLPTLSFHLFPPGTESPPIEK